MAYDTLGDLHDPSELLELGGPGVECEQVVEGIGLVFNLVGELSSAPVGCFQPAARALFNDLLAAFDDLALLCFAQLGVEHEQHFIGIHASDLSFLRS